ncbi:uncharacterized protein [Porites lutea]|uniref:uncharacterized protein n=1 Tax=Porites lutea TaxID=51062 RepID=UPI003CC61538
MKLKLRRNSSSLWEQHLHSREDKQDKEFNIKLDGHLLGGKEQVVVGLSPIDFENKTSESALSIYPIATGTVKREVTLDYKALLLLLNKKEQEDFILGGKGYGMEFCAFCDAVRACTCHGVEADETCLECLRSKANIGRWSDLRDDLNFLLEDKLGSINVCSLHCEMRNCVRILGSLGFFSYRVGSLDQ